jgi:hypothetical protein
MEITFDASESVGAISKYEWDFDADGTYDATTAEPVLRHTYANEFEGGMILRISNPIGSTHVLRTPVHISTTPAHQQLAPPKNVQAEALSTVNGVSEIKVTWESEDRAADSWELHCRQQGSRAKESPAGTIVAARLLGLQPQEAP